MVNKTSGLRAVNIKRMFSRVLIVLFIWVICANSEIMFNRNEFIMEVNFANIQHAVRSGYMTCDLGKNNLKVDENIYNGSHIIFGYERVCYNKSGIDHTKKENVYNEKFQCSYKFVDPNLAARICHDRVRQFVFEDTCAIAYDKACQQEYLGPCIGEFEENLQRENSSSVFLQFDNDTIVMVSSKDLQSAVGKFMTCTDVHHAWHEDETQYDSGDQIIFRYGNVTCAIEKTAYFVACPCCGPGIFSVQEKLGQKIDKKPVGKDEHFSK